MCMHTMSSPAFIMPSPSSYLDLIGFFLLLIVMSFVFVHPSTPSEKNKATRLLMIDD